MKMSQPESRATAVYPRTEEPSLSPQHLSPWSCPPKKNSVVLGRLQFTQTLSCSQSLQKLSLKPRLTMKKLAVMDDVTREKGQRREKLNRSMWAETQAVCRGGSMEEVHSSNSRRLKVRGSVAHAFDILRQAENPKVYELIPWAAPPRKEAKAPSPTLYINLPQLPFGRHKSYNDVKNIREFIVSRKQQAWRRVKMNKEFDEDSRFRYRKSVAAQVEGLH